MHYFSVTKSDYENLLKRIQDKLGDTDKESQYSQSHKEEFQVVDFHTKSHESSLNQF